MATTSATIIPGARPIRPAWSPNSNGPSNPDLARCAPDTAPQHQQPSRLPAPLLSSPHNGLSAGDQADKEQARSRCHPANSAPGASARSTSRSVVDQGCAGYTARKRRGASHINLSGNRGPPGSSGSRPDLPDGPGQRAQLSEVPGEEELVLRGSIALADGEDLPVGFDQERGGALRRRRCRSWRPGSPVRPPPPRRSPPRPSRSAGPL